LSGPSRLLQYAQNLKTPGTFRLAGNPLTRPFSLTVNRCRTENRTKPAQPDDLRPGGHRLAFTKSPLRNNCLSGCFAAGINTTVQMKLKVTLFFRTGRKLKKMLKNAAPDLTSAAFRLHSFNPQLSTKIIPGRETSRIYLPISGIPHALKKPEIKKPLFS